MEQKAVIAAGSGWQVKSVRDFSGSPVQRIGDDWMLVTAGDTAAGAGNWNTMTASWGAFGVLWQKDVAFMFIRPSRHTRSFPDTNALFTLSFFDRQYSKALDLCGEKSGKDCDKAAEAGLTPIVFDASLAAGKIAGAIAFREAAQIVVCRKIYTQDILPELFLDSSIKEFYPEPDYHRMYVGEVLALLSA